MCGIFGISYGPEGPDAEDWTPTEFMQIMFPAIVHRGPHAFGWMWYDGEAIWYQKHAGRVDSSGNLAKVAIEGDQSKVQWLVGHVRYYTHGTPDNPLNNHPIQHGNIIGVHNGVIRNYGAILAETGREDPATEVDSEAIFAAVDSFGHRAGLRRIQGDMVAVYANTTKPATLHVARTIGRPLEMCRTPAGSTFFASEGKVIEATGIEHTDFSGVSQQRLLRLRGGKVTERINLYSRDRLAEQFRDERAYHVPDRSAPPWFQQVNQQNRALPPGGLKGTGSIPAPPVRPQMRNGPITALADAMAAQESRRDARSTARNQESQRLRAAAADPRAKRLKDHDEFQGFYYLEGVLMTQENYMRTVADLTIGKQKEEGE